MKGHRTVHCSVVYCVQSIRAGVSAVDMNYGMIFRYSLGLHVCVHLKKKLGPCCLRYWRVISLFYLVFLLF